MANREVDTRIVEMQFDAKDFDKNIRKSQKSLEDFKKSLNFEDATKQMQAVTEESTPMGVALKSIAKNLAKLTKEFTGVGKISHFIAKEIKRTWEEAARSVERFVKSLTTDQIGEGRKKYDGLLKSVQTIINATGEAEDVVYDVMKKLNHYTDETSYNFADMADNIGKFTTAGVALEDAEAEMEGIANWAALAGQGVNEAQRAMYNISQAMSAGSMRLVDYKSIQNANMDIRKFRQEALDAAVAAGTLKKNAAGIYTTVKGNKQVNLDNFTETLQYQWFDKKTMETVFKVFADNTKGIGLEAYKAAQRCTTLNDAIGAWKDMLSTGWMKTYENIFGKLSEAMALFSGLCNKVSESLANLVDMRNEILSHWNLGGGRNSLWGALFGELESPDGETLFEGAYGILDAITDIGDAIREAFWDFVGNFIEPANKAIFEQDKQGFGTKFLAAKLMELTKKFQAFTQRIHDFLYAAGEGETETRMDRIKHLAQTIYSVVLLIVNVVRGIAGLIGNVLKQLSPAFYVIEQLIDGLVQMFTGAVVKGAKENSIGTFFQNLAEILRPITTVINVVVRALGELILKIAAALKESQLFSILGSAIKKVFEYISETLLRFISSGAFDRILEWVKAAIAMLPSLIERIKNMAKALATAVKNSKGLKSIGNFFSNLFSGKGIKEVLKNVKNVISNGLLKKLPSIASSLKSGASEAFGNLLGNLLGVSSASAEGAEFVSEQISEAIAAPISELGSGSVLANAIDKAKPGIFQTFKEKLKEIWKNITDFFTTIANSEALKKIRTFFEGTNFVTLLTGAKDILKWLAIFRTGSGLVSIGKGAKALGKGIKVFGKNLKNLNLSNIFSNMFNISNIINSNNQDNSRRTNFSNFGKQLLMIAAGVALVAAAGAYLAKMDPEELKQGGIALAAIIGGLLTAGFLAKKFAGNGGSLLALAAGILVLMIPLKLLIRMSWDTLEAGVLKLAAVLGILALAGRIAGNVKMKGFVGLAAAVTILLIPLKVLGNMKLFNTPGGTQGLVQGLLAIMALVMAMATAAAITGGNKMKGMLSMAIALTLLIVPIKMIGNMDLGKAALGVGSIILILTAITAMIRITKDIQVTKLSTIVGAIALLAGIGWLIGHTMNWEQALVGFAPILLMIGMMALMLKQASKLDTEQIKALKSIFTAFAITVAVIAAAIVAISVLNVDWSTIALFFGGIILTLAAVGAMLKLAAKTDAASISKAAIVLGLLSVLVLAVAGSVILMTKMNVDWTTIVGFMVGIAALIAVLGLVLPKLQGLTIKGAVVGVAALALAVIAIMGAIGLMVPYVLGQVGNSLETMASRLKTISGLLEDFFDRAASIDKEAVQHTMDIFNSLKELILSFVGFGDYAADIRSLTSQLLYMSAGLDMFFINDDKYPDPENSMSFKLLNKFVELGPSLAEFSAGSLPGQLVYLGAALRLFDESTKGITSAEPLALSLLQGIFGQAENIQTFANLPLDKFRSQMSGLGGAMSLYAKGAKEVTGLDMTSDEVPDISDSVEILKAVCNSISGEDGTGEFKIPENMPDSEAMGLFAGQLEALGTALSTFATAAQGMETNTTNALALLKFLARIGRYITEDNLSVVDVFDDVGHADANGGGKLAQFALDITALGTALSTFASSIGGSETQFSTGLSVLDKFGELNTKLTKDALAFTGAFNKAGVHASALEVFATDIGALGTSLKSFAQNVMMDDGTQVDFDHAINALNFLATIQSRLPNIGGLHGLIHGENESIGKLADDVQIMGQALHDFSVKITGTEEGGAFNLDPVNDALEFISKLVQITGVLNTKLFADGASAWGKDYGDAVENLVGFLSQIDSVQEGYYNGFEGLTIFDLLVQYARDITKAFDTVEDVDSESIAIFADIASALADLVALDMSSEFSYPGEMIAKGIATGIENGRSEVVKAAVDVVQAAIDAANETAVIKSPSKVFTEIGNFMDLGLVKGLEGGQSEVENASSDMTQAAIDQAATIMAAISQAMAENADLQPTITPVLDLSSITAASANLGRLFDGYALNLNAVLDRAYMATSGAGAAEVVVQNPTDLTGIQETLNGLQTEITGLQTAITNMKIVLNTGVIAGGVTDDVDLNLGRKNLYASRRN